MFLGTGPDSCSQGMASNHYRDRARQNVSDAAHFGQFRLVKCLIQLKNLKIIASIRDCPLIHHYPMHKRNCLNWHTLSLSVIVAETIFDFPNWNVDIYQKLLCLFFLQSVESYFFCKTECSINRMIYNIYVSYRKKTSIGIEFLLFRRWQAW